MSTTALIHGITGQTGAFLARELVNAGKRVVGTTRSPSSSSGWRLERIGVSDEISLQVLDATSRAAVAALIQSVRPDEIYFLAGPSSVAQSFSDPVGSIQKIYEPVWTFLSVLSELDSPSRFVNAASTDCFGNQPDAVLTEESPLRPLSPYATAKTATYWLTNNARAGMGLNASNAILTNHESPLRGPEFVTHKIVTGLTNFAEGRGGPVRLGNTAIARDWLWVGDVARALAAIGGADTADDFLVSSGSTHTLTEFVEGVCERLGVDMSDAIEIDAALYRPAEIERVVTHPAKIRQTLGWSATVDVGGIIERLVNDTIDN